MLRNGYYLFILVLVLHLVGCNTTGITEPALQPSSATDDPFLEVKPSDKTATAFTRGEASKDVKPTTSRLATFSANEANQNLPSIEGQKQEIPLCTSKGISMQISNKDVFSGSLIYQEGIQQGLYVFDTSLLKKEILVDENQEVDVLGLSPSGNWIAYSRILRDSDNSVIFDQPTIFLHGLNGELISHAIDVQQFSNEIEPDNYLIGFGDSHWINENLIFTILDGMRADGELTSQPETLPKILDPFKGTWELSLIENLINPVISQEINFSPDLSRVFYRSKEGFTIMDMEHRKPLMVESSLNSSTFLMGRWSPDSSKIVFTERMASPEKHLMYVATRDGKKKELLLPDFVYSGDFGWSSDSRYFAVVADIKGLGESEKTLYIYDTLENQFTLKCPVVGESEKNQFYGMHVSWSVDGTAIAFSGIGTPLRILEVATGRVFEVEANANLIGWSGYFPSDTR